MVRVWYMDDCDIDQRSFHLTDTSQFLNLDELLLKSGVEYFKIDADNYESDEKLKQIRHDRDYSYQDLLDISPDSLPDFEEKLKMFYTEHLHADEEIRLFVSGGGYFDVRDRDDKWIRIEVAKGDMLILPAGIYHRFSLDTGGYAKIARYFMGEPVWKAYNRPADNMEVRQKYVASMQAVSG